MDGAFKGISKFLPVFHLAREFLQIVLRQFHSDHMARRLTFVNLHLAAHFAANYAAHFADS